MSEEDTETKPEMRRHLVVTVDAEDNRHTVDALMALAMHLEIYGKIPDGEVDLDLNGMGKSQGREFNYEYTTSNKKEIK